MIIKNKSKINFHLQLIKKLLNSSKNSDIIFKYLLEELNNKTKYFYYLKKFKNNKDIVSGASGAIVGNYDKNNIIKLNIFKKNINPKFKFDNKLNCLKIYYHYNEIIINLLLSNISFFLPKKFKNTKSGILKIKNINKYILKIIDYGIYNNNTFLLNKKIGFKNENFYYTNINQIFLNNYIPLLKNAILSKNDNKTVSAFCYFINLILNDYFEVLKFLNEHFGFIHTDLKLENIFIKKSNKYLNNKSIHIQHLKSKGFIINYIPLVSDLDKCLINYQQVKNNLSENNLSKNNLSENNLSENNLFIKKSIKKNTVKKKLKSKSKIISKKKLKSKSTKYLLQNNIKENKINNIDKINNQKKLLLLPYDNSFKNIIAKYFGLGYIYDMRYLCKTNRKIICNKFEPYHFDRLTIIFEIYLIIFKHLEKKISLSNNNKNINYYKLFNIFNKNNEKLLNVSSKKIDLIYKTIKNNFVTMISKDEIKIGFHTNYLIGRYCNKIK